MQAKKINILILLLLLSCTIFSSGYFYININGMPLLSLLRVAFFLYFLYFITHNSKIKYKNILIFFILIIIIIENFIKALNYSNASYNIRLLCDCYFIPLIIGITFKSNKFNKGYDSSYLTIYIKLINFIIVIIGLVEIFCKIDIFPYNNSVIQGDIYRINSTFNSPEELTIYCTVMNLLLIDLFRRNFSSYILILLNLFLVYNTFFRTALVLNAFIVIIMPLFLKKVSKKYILSTITLLSILLFIIIKYLINPTIIQQRLLDPYSYITRLANYKLAFEYFKQKIFFGWGIGNYEKMLIANNVSLTLFGNITIPLTIHNAFLSIFVENGIIIGTLIIVCYVYCFNIKHMNKLQKFLLLIYIGFGMLFNINVLSSIICLLPILLFIINYYSNNKLNKDMISNNEIGNLQINSK